MGFIFVAVVAAAAVGVPFLWMRFRSAGPQALLPSGLTSTARFHTEVGSTRQLAQKLGRALRALDDPHLTKCISVKEAESARVALDYVGNPSDGTVGFLLFVRNSTSLRDGLEVEIRGARARMARMPKGPSQKVILAVSAALTDLGTQVRWSADGKSWRERPNTN